MTMTTKLLLTEALLWRAIGRLETGQSQIEVAGGLNVSPSEIHRLRQQFLTTDTDSAFCTFSQAQSRTPTRADDRYLS
ncbi:hypothetical protein TNCV_2252901 [Trichonephila clavipes]|nr:hypothetical protein TNCV_2252901 [Trichonephila clavipes]